MVDDSVAIITEHLALSPEIEHTGGRRGWTGDSPLIHLDTARIRGLGWRPTLTIREAVRAHAGVVGRQRVRLARAGARRRRRSVSKEPTR